MTYTKNIVFMILALLILSTLAAFSSPVPQLLKNGSFEDNLTGWWPYWVKTKEKDNQFKLDTTCFRDGKKSFHAIVTEEKGRLKLTSPIIKVIPQKTYRASFYYLTQEQKAGHLYFRITARDAQGKHIGYYGYRALPATGNLWINSDFLFTAPTGVATIKLEFNFLGPCEIWLDQVIFTKALANKTVDFSHLYPDNRPLYQELLKSNTHPESPRVYPYWSYYIGKNYHDTAMIIGVEHSIEGEFKEAAKYNLAPFYHSFARNYPEFIQKYKTPVMYYSLVGALAKWQKKNSSRSQKRWANGPAFVSTYLEVIENENFSKNLPQDVPQIIFIADEWQGSITDPAMIADITDPAMIADKTAGDKPVQEVIREKYGFGKFNPPESTSDPDPFRRIAWLRYNADKSVENLEKITSALRRKYPSALILGFDEWAAATPHDWSRLGELIDLQPGQSLPSASGFRQFSPAFIAKFHADLTQKPVYPYLQFIKYPTSITVKTLYEWCDRLFQGGADGIYIGAVEWFDRAVGHPKFSSPEKWEAMLNIIRRTQIMPKLDLPKDTKVALHFGSYTLMSKLRSPANNIFPAFSLLGPRCRIWFTITDDFQIERDIAFWDKYNLVVISEEKYISESMQNAINRFLERGGTLLVLDPEAFKYRIDGEDLSKYREELFGAKIVESPVTSLNIITSAGKKLPNTDSSNFQITMTDPANTKIMAKFDNGSPALIEHRIKNGKVLLAAFTVANNYSVDNPDWVEQWRKWLVELKVKLDEPIWRFQIPRDPLSEKIWRKYSCVSGNAMEYIRNYPDTSMNRQDASVTYQYRNPPLMVPDTSEKLIDRIKAKALKKNSTGSYVEKDKIKSENWIAKFGPKEIDENEITFTFNRKYPLRHGRIFFSGTLPECVVETKINGQWIKQADILSQNVGIDIRLVEFPLNSSTEQLRIILSKRPSNTTLTLVEMDFWAKK